jgi:hypothetical protein
MRLITRLLGPVSRISYHSRRYTLLGIPLDTLLLWACCAALAPMGWAWLTRSLGWGHGLLGMASILLIGLTLLQRAKKHTVYQRGSQATLDDEAEPLAPENLIRVRVSGPLQVEEKRGLFMDVPAVFWVTELGDYILMAQVAVRDYPLIEGPIDNEGMWYAFINPAEITAIEEGTLHFGAAIPVLRLDYQSGEEGHTLFLGCGNAENRGRLANDILSRMPERD